MRLTKVKRRDYNEFQLKTLRETRRCQSCRAVDPDPYLWDFDGQPLFKPFTGQFHFVPERYYALIGSAVWWCRECWMALLNDFVEPVQALPLADSRFCIGCYEPTFVHAFVGTGKLCYGCRASSHRKAMGKWANKRLVLKAIRAVLDNELQ
jgi:hypothetical protein